jgi:hypothetical protein
MARRVMISLFLIGIFGLTYLGYRRWSENRAMATGDVFPDSTERSPVPAAAAPTPTQLAPAPAQPAPPIASPPAKSSAAAPAPSGPTASRQTPLPPQGQGVAAVQAAGPAAAADTLSPNPPNGRVFAGAGRFQLYRQGSLTWRIDTNTGQTCILFATNAEWRKPQVYRHGCNSSAAR